MPDCGVHYLWFAFVCFLMRSPPPPPPKISPAELFHRSELGVLRGGLADNVSVSSRRSFLAAVFLFCVLLCHCFRRGFVFSWGISDFIGMDHRYSVLRHRANRSCTAMPRGLLNNSASPGGGCSPPPNPDFIVGKDEILQKEIWLLLVHNLLAFWVVGPPPPQTPFQEKSGHAPVTAGVLQPQHDA